VGERPSISLELPADPRFLVVARSIAAGVAAGLDLPYDTVDDLRIAVDEAASLLLALPAPATRLTIHLRSDPTALRMSISTNAEVDPWPPGAPGQVDGLSWLIISRLVDEAVAEGSDVGPSIRMTVRTLRSGAR
jgi:serine/threonine-protein kinase RsbW